MTGHRRPRRSPAMVLLLLLAVTFGPMLCRIGGDQAWAAERTTAVTAAVADARPHADAPVATADAGKRCSNRHAPAPDESAPLPAPHRGEPLAPDATGPGPLAADTPAQFALARPPTGGALCVDHTALLPVLRI